MRYRYLILFAMCARYAFPQGTVPTFSHDFGGARYTLAGSDPAKNASTTIPTVLVTISLVFETKTAGGKMFALNAGPDANPIIQSPVFTRYAFPSGGHTQYADAMLRSMFPQAGGWHTILGKPEIRPVRIAVPAGYGYVLTSRSSGRSVGVADVEYVQKELFRQIPKQEGKLILALTHNTAFYALGDATVCCSWGTHGIDSATGNSFVLASYLENAPAVVEDRDLQPLTQQLAQLFKDPLHDPLVHGRNVPLPGNAFPAWMRPAITQAGVQPACGGTGAGSTYFLLEPTDTNPKNNFPASKSFEAAAGGRKYHLQNVALMSWYTGDSPGGALSFPDAQALTVRSAPCPSRGRAGGGAPAAPAKPTIEPVPLPSKPSHHKLIGYWAGYGGVGSTFPLREVSPQWDIVIVAFSTPDKNAPEGTMQFRTPAGLDTAEFRSDIRHLQSQGRKVMISLGGGGQHFTLADPKRIPNFVSSVTRIVEEYGFDGIDIDFESPSLAIAPGDTDFRHPKTPSIVNLIDALRQLRQHFGSRLMMSLVPEGTQIPAGFPSYGGQFGSYLPIAYALRDTLAFMDTQDYNTPPLQGLDGEIYQAGSVDYHAAMTELVLHGFPAGGDPGKMFPPMPADKIAVGFLTGDTTPEIVNQAMEYLITGKAPPGTKYKLRKTGGYPAMIGAMFWTIDADRRGSYRFSNAAGPLLHNLPSSR